MSRPGYTHYVVTRDGAPCVLLLHPSCPKGVMVPAIHEEPTRFTCMREKKYPTIYAQRRAMRAITQTTVYLKQTQFSKIEDRDFVQRVLLASGNWRVVPAIVPELCTLPPSI